MPEEQITIRWGIISTGGIARSFIKDLLIDPRTRRTHDVVHKAVAVGSRTIESARAFIDSNAGGDKSIKAYGTYAEVYTDPEVDAIYIGTPHTLHYENAVDAIKAKKHVLVEKAATSNAAEWRALCVLAKEAGVFLMEAMWTRFQPVAHEVKKVIDEGNLGAPVVMHGDLSGDFDLDNIPPTHRILDPRLGGGAILDLGPYPLVWAVIALYEYSANNKGTPSVSASIIKTRITGVDRNTSFTLNFPDIDAQAVLSCSINLPATPIGATIRFRNGNIIIPHPLYCPKEYTVQYFDKPGGNEVYKQVTTKVPYVGMGLHFEADELARCVRDGKLESELWGHNKTLLAMTVYDEVRRQGDYKFPEGVEKVF
ncbi:hypothetical protein OF83DRAFT_1052271 [Amylostereum chailletii]|nr:hypothetical protein OF83DRAFT_1052271 [Amylostereum chailletii]